MASPYDHLTIGGTRSEHLPFEPATAGHWRNGIGAWTQYLAARATLAITARLPRLLRDSLVGGVARLAMGFDERHREPACDFVRTALPDRDSAEVVRLVRGAYRHLFEVALESERMNAKLLGRPLGEHFEFEFCPGFHELVARAEGGLFITPHIGNWEVIGMPLAAMGFSPLTAVGKPLRNGPMARHLQRRRQAFGGYFVPREGAMRSVPAIVRAGGGVVLFLDQRGRKKPILADFFGRPAHSDRSAGVLVRRVGAPLVVLACYATECPWRYRMVFQRIVTPEELSGSSPAQVIAIINREMEVLIRRHPEQYFWLHDRYKGAPASSPPPPA